MMCLAWIKYHAINTSEGSGQLCDMLVFQLEDSETLGRVMLYCQATAGLMMTELHKLSNENLLIKAGERFSFSVTLTLRRLGVSVCRCPFDSDRCEQHGLWLV